MSRALYHAPAKPRVPTGTITLTLSVREALELRAILLGTYGIESDLESSLSMALTDAYENQGYINPFRTKLDDDNDYLVYEATDAEEADHS